jgi:hypothetical protein
VEAVIRFGGHVAKYLGDVVMAYLGWSEAHDNDGELAVRAALGDSGRHGKTQTTRTARA